MQDIFGKALMDHFSGRREPLILRREDGRENEFPLEALFSSHHEWFEWEKEALEHAEGRVLDVGCGVGRHSLWLQEKGFDVVATDVSPLAVEVAKARGLKNVIVLLAQNLAFTPSSFKTILLMGNNFGMCGTIAETKDMMKQLHRIIASNGIAVVTSLDVTKTSDPEHLAYQELNRKRGRPVGQATLRLEYRDDIGEWFYLLNVGPELMEEICKPVGWIIERIYRTGNKLYAAVLRSR